MTTLNQSSILTIAVIRFEHLPLAWLEKHLSNSWRDIRRGKPKKHITFSLSQLKMDQNLS